MIQIRASNEQDAHYLLDIDIKCFDYAWLPKDWRRIAQDCMACVATWRGTPIGMVVFRNNRQGDVEIEKVAVKAPFRHQGIGRRLIHNCAMFAREIGAIELLMLVPEGRLRPGEPDDISGWLTKLGFRAEVPLLRDYFTFYGQPEDGVLFSHPIPLA
jgi:GNAT superfamily N-acetyltransferase